jgi:hypothetical protein
MSHPLRYGDLVAHMPDYPPVLVTACCDPDQGKAKEDIFEQPFVPDPISDPHRIPAGTSPIVVALLSARECVFTFLRRTTNGHICTLDSGGVLALHL